MVPANRKKILVISLQGVGDLVLLTPALSLLRKTFPNAYISMMILKHLKDVIDGNPDVDEIITYDTKKDRSFARLVALVFRLRQARFDISICAYPTGLRSALLGYVSGANTRVGQKLHALRRFPCLFNKQVNVNAVKHAVEMNLDLVKAIGGLPDALIPKLVFPLTSAHRESIREFEKKMGIADEDTVICIHPGASKWGKSRLWSPEKFAEVANKLSEEFRAKVVILGTGTEKDAVEKINAAMTIKPVLFLDMPLKIMAALVEKSDLFIGINSGPMHIAAAVGAPTIGLFGDTDPRIHRPYGERCVVIRKGLECSPCYYPHLHGTIPEAKLGGGVVNKRFVCEHDNFACMRAISVEDVLAVAREMLGNEKRKA